MLPTTPNLRLFLFAFCLLIFDFCCAHPTPYSHTSAVFPRQETSLTLPITVKHTERITTGVGTFIQTCTINLSPTVVDGVNMVKEEKTCVLTHDNGNGDIPGAMPPPASGSTVSTELPSSTSDSPPSLTSTSGTLSSTSNDVPSNTVSPVISITLTFVPRPSESSSVSLPPSSIGSSSVLPNPTATPQPGSTGSSTGSLANNLGTSTVPIPQSSSPSPTPASENAGAAAPFDPPGKKIEVLPIGLGVFAGVSAIALLVVGVVTYERAKHRRNFRKLKLEEAGARMGYGAA